MSAFGGKADITIEANTGRSGWFFPEGTPYPRDTQGGAGESLPDRERPAYFSEGTVASGGAWLYDFISTPTILTL